MASPERNGIIKSSGNGVKGPRFSCWSTAHIGPGDEPGALQLVDRKIEDIPITEGILIEISKHASGHIFADSDIQGAWCEAEDHFLRGLEQAVRKRYDLSNYRLDAQRRFKDAGWGSPRSG
jgi:hypothetical protein